MVAGSEMRESEMRASFVLILVLLLAPLAQAQAASYIGCDVGAGGDACTESTYGFGDTSPELPFTGSGLVLFVGPGDGSCGLPEMLKELGQVVLRELDDCVVSASNRCLIEIPQRGGESGFWLSAITLFDLGPLGFVGTSVNRLDDIGLVGNIGHRQLHGSCTDDGGEDCALDSDCPSGTGCLSTCFASNGNTHCASQADCPNADCITEIEWDDIGTCTDDATLCTSDADCTAPDVCEPGIDWVKSDTTCSCCQSVSGSVCPLFGLVEYPALSCPEPDRGELAALGSPDWLFEGGAGTPFDMEETVVPGQQEGKCAGNLCRPCGQNGDFWAGAAAGKCGDTFPATGFCPDPVIGDPTEGALASACDDVAFGGIAGDFCDLSEAGIRENLGKFADGTPDPSRCSEASFKLVGTPNEGCSLQDFLPEGDPQPGCLLANLGEATRPDMDCNGIDDTIEGHCMPVGGAICSDPSLCPACTDNSDCASGNCINNGDLCPWIGEINRFLDTNNDDIGDECQCGDQNGDGAISGPDIAAPALCANGALPAAQCDATILDATGDNATTAEDVGVIVSAVNGVVPTSDLLCVRNLDTSTP